MIVTVNNCRCCDLPCVDCGAKHEEVRVCDRCWTKYHDADCTADYEWEDEDLCEECLWEALEEMGLKEIDT